MQLYEDGVQQGSSVTASYIGWKNLERPTSEAFDGTWVRNVCGI